MLSNHIPLSDFLEQSKKLADSVLEAGYAHSKNSLFENTEEAKVYSLFQGGGGKRSRSALLFAANQSFNGVTADSFIYSRAIEELHTYTLMIDDFQDNDDYRRGDLSSHKKFGIDTMLMASEQLFARAMYTLFAIDSEYLRALILTKIDKLHKGQAADILSREWGDDKINIESLRFIFSGKTSALFEIALCCGAYSANNNIENKVYEKLCDLGHHLGILYQLRDDDLEISEDPGISIGKVLPNESSLIEEIDFHKDKSYSILDNLAIKEKSSLRDIVNFMVKRSS